MNKIARIISNIVYGFGAAIVVCLFCIALFGPNVPMNPESMIPFTWKELALLWLSFGSIPMLLASMAIYKFNGIKNSQHKKRNFFLIFLPCFICAACILFIVGALVVEIVKA